MAKRYMLDTSALMTLLEDEAGADRVETAQPLASKWGPVARMPAAELAGCLRRAAATAAYTCSKIGANLPTRAELDGFLSAR